MSSKFASAGDVITFYDPTAGQYRQGTVWSDAPYEEVQQCWSFAKGDYTRGIGCTVWLIPDETLPHDLTISGCLRVKVARAGARKGRARPHADSVRSRSLVAA